jgi:hypothetical protein
MLTTDDFRLLLQVITSDRLALRGNEVGAIFNLQRKLALTIDAAKPQEKDDGANSTGLTE